MMPQFSVTGTEVFLLQFSVTGAEVYLPQFSVRGAEVYSEHCRTSKVEWFAKIVNSF